jgi:quercetin dioxygenase-like cupin family protein
MRFHALAAATAAALTMGGVALAQGGGHTVITSEQLNWQPAPPALPPGAEIAVMRGDPTAAIGTFAMRLRVPAGYAVAPHWHPTDENLTVVSGTMVHALGQTADRAQATELGVGSYVFLPAKEPHYVWAGDQGFVLDIQAAAPFDLTYVNPDDDPRQLQASR